ncbi:MAG: acetylornithine deacetylase [Gammaproteobacteria bacterium]
MAKTTPTLMDSFTQLIAMPTVSSVDPSIDQANQAAIDALANWFADLGCEVITQTVKPGKSNLIATLGNGEGGLVLSGHTDTVPYSESAWRQDPFRLTEQDGRLYGLGSSDMKCFFPIVLDVLREIDSKQLKQPVYLLATCDEESTMGGARALLAADYKLGRYALIGEPTGLKPITMHKGVMFDTIKLTGQAGHASNPALGNSALEGMHAVISKLLKWRATIQQQFVNDQFKVPVPTVNFGSIHGGDNPNRICADCRLALDLRLLPGMELDQIRQQLRQTALAAVDGLGLKVEFHNDFDGVPPFETDSNSKIVQLAQELTGLEPQSVDFATEGPYLNRLGMDTVILGPGDIEQAHQANEYIEIDRIRPMRDIIKQMIERVCC